MKKAFYLAPLVAMTLAGHVMAEGCEVTIDSNDMMKYDKSEIVVAKSCGEVTLTLTHSGALPAAVMGHNWILAKTGEWQALAGDAMAVGPDKHYLPEGDECMLAHTDLIGGGESTSVTFDVSGLDPEGDYTFFCSFPGHSFQMNGKFRVE